MENSLTNVYSNFIDLRRIDDNSIIIDAGACFGLFIEALRKKPEASKCRVIALECDRDNAKALERKKFLNLKICKRALVGQSSAKNTLFYQYVGLPGWGSTINRRVWHKKCKEVRKYEVGTVRINDIFKDLSIEHIDFLKMDIEGAEMEVLDTMTRKTASKITQLSVEVHKPPLQESRPVFKKMLERLGYKAQIVGVDVVYGIQKRAKGRR